MSNPVGAPNKVTPEQKGEIIDAFIHYIATEDDPTIVGFCAYEEVATKYRVTKDNIHDWKEFSELRKLAIQKQEAYLVRQATQNKINPTVAIFRLKQPQHGWRDKTEQDITSGGNAIAPVLVKFIGEEHNVKPDHRNTDGV